MVSEYIPLGAIQVHITSRHPYRHWYAAEFSDTVQLTKGFDAWLAFDLCNGDSGKQRYVWVFKTRKEAVAHMKSQNANPQNAQLSYPEKWSFFAKDADVWLAVRAKQYEAMMSLDQFRVLSQLMRTGPNSRKCAKLVLVDGLPPGEAAKLTGCSAQAASMAIKRYREAHAAVAKVY